MIERVAEALWQEESLRALGRRRSVSWSEVDRKDQERWRGFARAAIAAMREPTEKMLRSSTIALLTRAEAKFGWIAMIDAALAEAERDE